MYNTIICAVEIGEEGNQLLAKAQQMAEKFDSKLVAINVLPYDLLPKNYQKELEEKAIPAFGKMVSSFGLSDKNWLVKVGKPYEIICNLAEKEKADLIMLGTHSKKGLRSLLGSTATAVSNHANCDVTLVRI
ncbi:universal stress protein [Thalassotalea euphylliae]|uniref:Universal stress protein n=1 Tax=Thalassotalea euphylliae TaxID=1655234 RepID=A0A3E0TSB6_9GAMM|nr:universal stress protein [Thalassotalea euphylliae]REL27428.1 universal stress protein [Thalassotalea euphylliae]